MHAPHLAALSSLRARPRASAHVLDGPAQEKDSHRIDGGRRVDAKVALPLRRELLRAWYSAALASHAEFGTALDAKELHDPDARAAAVGFASVVLSQ